MGVSSSPGGRGIAWFAHLGGLAFGWVYLRMSSFGGLDNFRRWVSPVPDEPEDCTPRGADAAVRESRAIATQWSRRSRGEEQRSRAAREPVRSSMVPTHGRRRRNHAGERLDMVLDKISKHGIESLTSEEVDCSRTCRESCATSKPLTAAD